MSQQTGFPVRVLIPPVMRPDAPVLGSTVHALYGESMGTNWNVKVAAHPECDLARLGRIVREALAIVDGQMSTWRADSDLSRFNHAAPEEWIVLPSPLFDVLSCALMVAQESGGAFDPTSGPLVNLWGFGPGGRFRDPGHTSPQPNAIESARVLCGWQRVQVDATRKAVRQPGGVYLDLSGIAKGYAVDLVARSLGEAGYTKTLVEIGGELRGSGVKPNGQPWWVALETPRYDASLGMSMPPYDNETRVALHDLSIATSGNYRRSFRNGQHLAAHTIDPRTGYPVDHALASVTVLHPECMLADAYSTALTVLGTDAGLAYANRHGIAANFVSHTTEGWQEACSDTFLAMME